MSKLDYLMQNFDQGIEFCKEHSVTILQGLACVGMCGTIALSLHAGRKIQIKREEIDRKLDERRRNGEEITPKMVKLAHLKGYFPDVLPAVATGTITMLCGAGAVQIVTKKLVATSTAYTLTSKAFDEYKQATQKVLGDKEDEIKRERLKNDVQKDPMSKEMEEKVKKDYERAETNPTNADLRYGIKPVWRDRYTGQYIYASRDQVRDAIEEFNVEIRTSDDSDFHCWNDFLINIPGTDYNRAVGAKIGFYKADFPDGVKFDLTQSVMADNGINIAEIAVKDDQFDVFGLMRHDKACGDGIWYGR